MFLQNNNKEKTMEIFTVEEVDSEGIATNVDETIKDMKDTLNKVQVGQEYVIELPGNISTIKTIVENMGAVIYELMERSNRIKEMVDNIKERPQTAQLLPLDSNAEGVRAGDLVDVGEAKGLAESSARFADEIDHMILEITSVTQETIQIINEGKIEVSQNTKNPLHL